MFIPIQKILPQAINNLGLKRETEAALVCEKYRQLAPRLVHAQALQYTLPKSYKGKTLTVGVADPAWAPAVPARTEDLIRELNGHIGKKLVERIRTSVVERLAA